MSAARFNLLEEDVGIMLADMGDMQNKLEAPLRQFVAAYGKLILYASQLLVSNDNDLIKMFDLLCDVMIIKKISRRANTRVFICIQSKHVETCVHKHVLMNTFCCC